MDCPRCRSELYIDKLSGICERCGFPGPVEEKHDILFFGVYLKTYDKKLKKNILDTQYYKNCHISRRLFDLAACYKFGLEGIQQNEKEAEYWIERAIKMAEKSKTYKGEAHSSVLDSKYLRKGMDFSELPETFVIFITENDVVGENEPIYFVERVFVKSGRLFGDGEHIIYVNASYKDDTTELGRLMHDFFCTDPNDMDNEVLAEKARYYKEDEEGVKKMCKVLEDMRNEVREQALAKGIKEGEKKGLILAYLQSEISQSAVMRILDITDDEFDDLVSFYNQ
ncbi:MAG: hypothetical protein IJT72_01625 [Lachnospiraceae bacterium]|nr:hypothetical protein [Lachnospiraceae bacterium]